MKYNTFALISGLIFVTLVTVSYSSTEVSKEATKDDLAPTHDLPQLVKGVPMYDNITFAGEKMPINPDTRERLDRELSVNAYWQSSTLLNLKAANKYFPTIERILAEQGVPDDFKYLAVAESNLRNVTSSASAKGFWQFRKPAAKEYDLEVNREVDERYHLEKSTRAAAQYLKRLKSRFGSWANAAAAYNVGPTRFARMLQEQDEESYYDLHMNSETSRYVFRLIAIKEIMKNPTGFGFHIDPKELYEASETYSVEVSESVPSWPEFAKEHGVSYRMLKYYNPWLIDTKLTVKKNRYLIKLPKNS
jgi:membrane-bound lytic murein transglycosylase D